MKNLRWMVALAMGATAWANSVDLSGPQGTLGYADSKGWAQYELNYQTLDAGDGIKLPIRYLFNSGANSGGLGWTIPLLTSHAIEFDPLNRYGYIEATLLCGKKLYFQFPAGWAAASFVQRWLYQTTTTSQDGQWTAVVTGFPTSLPGDIGTTLHDFTLTVTRWDGWRMYFGHGGRLETLTTDTGKVLNWNYDGSGKLTSITLAATNATLLSATYSGSNLTAITVNGDVYHPQTNAYGQLTQIEHPDGTLDTFTYTNFSATNLATYGNTSNPSDGNASIEHTNRYGFKRKLTWEPVNHFLVSDGQWTYSIDPPPVWQLPSNWLTGGPGGISISVPVGLYNAAYMKRTRIATGEWEKITFDGDRDATHTFRGVDGSETRFTESKGFGPTYGKTTKVEKKISGTWTQTMYAAYDQSTGRVIRITDANGKDTVYTYTNHTGAISLAPPATKTVTDPTGVARVYTYDARGNLTKVANAAGVERSYEYDSRDRRIKVKNDAGAVVAQYAYNNNNRVTSFKDADSNEITFQYLNRYGRSWLTRVTTPTGLVTEFTYDAHGNRTSVKDLNGQTWTLTPNADNLFEKITDPLSHETEFTYDSRKNLASVENALHDTMSFEYDDLDQTKKITDALTHVSTYSNNGDEELTSLSDNRAKPYGFEYTIDGLRKKLTFPDSTTITADHDLMGRLIKKTFRGGGYVNIGYDDAGRLTGLSQNGGSVQNINYTDGKLSSIANPVTTSESYSYNSEGRLAYITHGSDGTTGLTYYPNGRLKELTYPTGMVVKYEYDTEGRVSKIYKDAVQLVTYTYDTAGRLSAKAFGSSSAITEGYGYNTLSQLTGFSISKTSVLWSAEYGYNAIGNRTYTKFLPGTGDVYQYDAEGQVTGFKQGATNPQSGFASATSPAGATGYAYDAAGNRSTATNLLNGWTVTYTANDLNQYSNIAGDVPLTYDSRGNVSGRLGQLDTYEYDVFGHLVAYKYNGATACVYKFDALGRRVQKYKSSSDYENHYNLGAQLLWIKKHSGSTDTKIAFIYEPGIDQPVAQVEITGSTTQVYYVHRDVLNSVVALSNDSGLVQTYAYDAWGGYSTAVNTGSAISRFLYTGRESDSETGMYYYRARNYWPQYGRFIQLDPIDFAGGDLNLYRYVANNPVNMDDPLGLWTLQLGVAGSGNFGFGNVNFSVGIAVDGHGHAGLYGSGGFGVATGAGAVVGGSIQGSNGRNIGDLTGPFANGAVGGGDLLAGSIDSFAGETNDGYKVYGGGLTAGAGFGAGESVTSTNTGLWAPFGDGSDPGGTPGGNGNQRSGGGFSRPFCFTDTDGDGKWDKATPSGPFTWDGTGEPVDFGPSGPPN